MGLVGLRVLGNARFREEPSSSATESNHGAPNKPRTKPETPPNEPPRSMPCFFPLIGRIDPRSN